MASNVSAEVFGEKVWQKLMYNTLKIRQKCKINRKCLKWTNIIRVFILVQTMRFLKLRLC